MRRRRLLAAAGGMLGGCAGVPSRGTPTPTATPVGELPVVRHGNPPTVCEEAIKDDAGIRAIVDPAFAADWSGVDAAGKYLVGDGPGLVDRQTVVGIERGGAARAYPLSVLWWHEIVNDRLEGPVLATYCPLCRSGMVAERRVAGEPATFDVSGLLWDPPGIRVAAAAANGTAFGVAENDTDAAIRRAGNLVLYDLRTRSYWSQILAKAICGPRAGEELSVLPAATATWGEWRAAHPGTDVLLPPPRSGLL